MASLTGTKMLLWASISTVLIASSGASSAAVLTYDFEDANTQGSPGAYYYASGFTQYSSDGKTAASAPGVIFSGMSGVQNNAGAWGFPTAPAPGTNAAFIQSFNGQPSSPGIISLDLSSLVAGQAYSLTFFEVGRPGTGADPFSVAYGSTSWSFTPTFNWTQVTETFVAQAGVTSLVFTGAILGGDHASGIDNVTLSAVPEPATWAMMLMGFASIGLLAYRRKRAPSFRLA